MPQPIKTLTGLSARGGPKIILERHKLAALLGAISAEWGDIDTLFSNIFNLITFAKFIPIGAHSSSPLSSAVFDKSFISHSSKIDVIERILKLRYTKDIVEEFSKIAKEIRKKATSRNTLIHCTWQICDEYPEDLIQIEKQKWIRYTERDFTDTLDRSIEIRNKLNDYFIKLSHTERIDIE